MADLRIDAEELEETAEKNQSKIRILQQTEATIRKQKLHHDIYLKLPVFVSVVAISLSLLQNLKQTGVSIMNHEIA